MRTNKVYTFTLSPSTDKQLDALANTYGLSRSALVSIWARKEFDEMIWSLSRTSSLMDPKVTELRNLAEDPLMQKPEDCTSVAEAMVNAGRCDFAVDKAARALEAATARRQAWADRVKALLAKS